MILQYDPDIFDRFGQPLDQANPHHSGPESAEARYFLYTGNTRWGVQNLEYDPASRLWLTCVYDGRKEHFTNFHMFLIDAAAAPTEGELVGRDGEKGSLLTLAKLGQEGMHGIWGNFFPLGSTGVASLGDGRFYFSKPVSNAEEKTYSSQVGLYRLDAACPQLFTPCE